MRKETINNPNRSVMVKKVPKRSDQSQAIAVAAKRKRKRFNVHMALKCAPSKAWLTKTVRAMDLKKMRRSNPRATAGSRNWMPARFMACTREDSKNSPNRRRRAIRANRGADKSPPLGMKEDGLKRGSDSLGSLK